MTSPSLWRRIRNSISRSLHKRRAAIDISNDGFVLTLRKRAKAMRWTDVTRIDAGLRDYLTFDGLYVVMFARAARLELDELDDGFLQFENALFERWPLIRDRWNEFLSGNLHEPRHETLWQR